MKKPFWGKELQAPLATCFCIWSCQLYITEAVLNTHIAIWYKNRSSVFVLLVPQLRSAPFYCFADTHACAVSAGIPPAARLQ
jgi:hypothetical protein